MAWISLTALRLDHAEAEARRHAVLEENVRLALWRMESAVGPLIAQETSRPYFSYSPFYAANRAYTRMFSEMKQGEVLVPSPLLRRVSPYIVLHFQFGPDGELTSPQVPEEKMREIAEGTYTTRREIDAAAARLAELRELLPRDKLVAVLSRQAWELYTLANAPFPARGAGSQQGGEEQSIYNFREWQARAYNQDNVSSNTVMGFVPRFPDVGEGAMRAAWVGHVLVLARRVSVNGEEYLQGCWLDWSATKKWLVESARELLPNADLEPVASGPKDEQASGRMLAALPVKLIPGAMPLTPAEGLSPVRLSLVIAWMSVLLAALAVGALLRGAVSLSERRGSFVSAVTHELRTPLTTLQMYTEMLAEGIVSGEEKTRRYLSTLRAEAERLGHLVENVLAYARLEARSSGFLARIVGRDRLRARRLAVGRMEDTTVRELLDRITQRLGQRAEQGEMNLVLAIGDDVASMPVRADASALEHILFNLVDNACKYAAVASDRVIRLEAVRKGNQALVSIRDHGPGISRGDVRRLFRPFCKSARDAANSKPGVGLGLALSRRLARAMGGDLRLDDSVKEGACFVLSLPANNSRAS
jgi:signal transduction histidine kinase